MMQQVQDVDMQLQAVLRSAIEKCVNEYYPDVEVKIEHAEGLAECKKILMLWRKSERMNGCLIEGMGCPGGCIAGAGDQYPGSESEEAACQLCQKFFHGNSGERARRN